MSYRRKVDISEKIKIISMESNNEQLIYELIDIEWHIDYDFEIEDHVSVVADCSSLEGFENPDKQEPKIERDAEGIPMGNSPEEKEMRREIIYNFLAQWRTSHPQEAIVNKDLKEPIKVVHRSLSEASAHTARSYKSTKAFLQLDTILMEAKKYGESLTKADDKSQKNLEKMIIMTYRLENLGLVKLTVGVRRKTHEKIEYGLTVPPKGIPLIEPELRIQDKTKKKKASHRKR